eukprot:CAMPEP_0206607326 /NCGR_PEP_ID=MMETSP0325_2-20121206/52069_1 /ASSEMBLY_ACC=CAM_ASM_000347 /TAXON_ID=2866 /ORGANISM="Crypthecodinium cohnii, Strain Seligo" /LENGTH=101 /DNA_ID=CAMNT_0054124289 /DNA_START=180 /DNA_END=485 /DNA_ORIENTATION=-
MFPSQLYRRNEVEEDPDIWDFFVDCSLRGVLEGSSQVAADDVDEASVEADDRAKGRARIGNLCTLFSFEQYSKTLVDGWCEPAELNTRVAPRLGVLRDVHV